jgi:histidine ammonia-lyase
MLDGASLRLADLVSIASNRQSVALAAGVRQQMQAHRDVVIEALARGDQVYGLTTGVAERKRVRLARSDQARFNRSLLRNHRMAQGPPAPLEVVRAAMAILANSFAKGVAGVRPELAELLVTALHEGVEPLVRTLGSVGQADLGPLADMADWLVEWSGLELAENEGLALIDTNAFSTACAALAVARTEQLLDGLEVAAALDFEGFAANVKALHPVVAEVRPSPGLARTLGNVRRLLAGSVLFDDGVARNLQDPLTFRCVPQINGAARDAVAYTKATVERELNASQGNPIDPVAMSAAVDFARIGLAPAITSATERTVKLLQRPFSALAAGLSEHPETGDDGLAELAVVSQAVAAEARLLAQPVSYELASTSKAEGIEDRTTMAPLSARRLEEVCELAARVIAVELVVAAQAVDLRRLGPLGGGTQAAYDLVRLLAPPGTGTSLPDDLEPLVEAVRAGELSSILHQVAPP